METYQAKLCKAVTFNGGQILIHEDGDATTIEIGTGCGWRLGKLFADGRGKGISRRERGFIVQAVFSPKIEIRDKSETNKERE